MHPNKTYEAFLRALLREKQKWGRGFGAELARRIEKSPQYVDKILKGKSYGTEAVRRQIAQSLGYQYESFLASGLEQSSHPQEKDSAVVQPDAHLEELMYKTKAVLTGEDKATAKALEENINTFYRLAVAEGKGAPPPKSGAIEPKKNQCDPGYVAGV